MKVELGENCLGAKLRGFLGSALREEPAAPAQMDRKRQNRHVDIPAPALPVFGVPGEPKNQFSLTRAALSTCGAQKANSYQIEGV